MSFLCAGRIQARRETHGRFGWVGVGLLVACAACAATSPGQTITLESADLACERDEDCQIAARDITGCCRPCPVQPFAIANKAAATYEAACRGTLCTMEGCDVPGIARPSEFVAVCVRHSCRRRPAPPPPPECLDDGHPTLCP